MINVFQPAFGPQERDAVTAVLSGHWVGRGPETEAFERDWAAHLGTTPEHVTSVSNCTAGTFLAMDALGIVPGDEVVLPSVSFVGAANAIASRGAQPVFCDVDRRTLNPSVSDVDAVVSPRTKAVLILHYGGRPGAVRDIAEYCGSRGLVLIEDAANAQCSSVDGQACGTFGDVGVWSFDHGKIVVSVDGGMVYARDPVLALRIATLANLGMEQRSGFHEARGRDSRWWDFDVSAFAGRSMMNDVLAAIGRVQLARLDEFLKHRRAVFAHYNSELADVPGLLLPPPFPAGHENSYYLYAVQMDPAIRDSVARALYERGIYTTFRYRLLHRIPAYGQQHTDLPNAQWAAEATLCLPVHHGLTEPDLATIVTALRDAVGARGTTAA